MGYIHSETGSTPRSASVITVTNEGTTPCTVSIDWRKGFSATGLGGVICTTTFASLGRGQSADLCSRSLPEEVTVCNAVCSPELIFDEGNAVVGSTNTAACAKITVSARTYYFNSSDTDISGIDNPKITKFAVGNVGNSALGGRTIHRGRENSLIAALSSNAMAALSSNADGPLRRAVPMREGGCS